MREDGDEGEAESSSQQCSGGGAATNGQACLLAKREHLNYFSGRQIKHSKHFSPWLLVEPLRASCMLIP